MSLTMVGLPWVSDSAVAGTIRLSMSFQAIQIKLQNLRLTYMFITAYMLMAVGKDGFLIGQRLKLRI